MPGSHSHFLPNLGHNLWVIRPSTALHRHESTCSGQACALPQPALLPLSSDARNKAPIVQPQVR